MRCCNAIDCHKNAAAGQFAGLSTACYSCHQKDFQTPVLESRAAGFSTTCETCHTVNSWFNAKFDHLKLTGYALTGRTPRCRARPVTSTMYFKGRRRPATAATQPTSPAPTIPACAAWLPARLLYLPLNSNWLNAKFDHALYANYPLTGAHATVTCAQCHVNNNYVQHPPPAIAATRRTSPEPPIPNHVAAGFPTDCTLCHTTTAGPRRPSTTRPAFPLTGAHLTVACAQCHTNNNYTTVPTDCYSCHKADYTGTKNPNHVTAGFPTTCATCHNTSSWTSGDFQSQQHQRFRSRARTSPCLAQVPRQQQLHNTAHSLLRLPPGGLHRNNESRSRRRGLPHRLHIVSHDHDLDHVHFQPCDSVFPLTGAHATVPCAQCHTNNNYTTLPTACYGCHQADYNGTTNPNHMPRVSPPPATLATPQRTGRPSTFNHATYANYPLTGRSRHGDLRPVPHQQQLHQHANSLLLMPPGGFHWNHESQSRDFRLPHGLLDLPHHQRLEPRRRSITTTRRSH